MTHVTLNLPRKECPQYWSVYKFNKDLNVWEHIYRSTKYDECCLFLQNKLNAEIHSEHDGYYHSYLIEPEHILFLKNKNIDDKLNLKQQNEIISFSELEIEDNFQIVRIDEMNPNEFVVDTNVFQKIKSSMKTFNCVDCDANSYTLINPNTKVIKIK